jgi:hypothetical protein
MGLLGLGEHIVKERSTGVKRGVPGRIDGRRRDHVTAQRFGDGLTRRQAVEVTPGKVPGDQVAGAIADRVGRVSTARDRLRRQVEKGRASLGVFFDRIDYPDVAATLYGAATRSKAIAAVPGLPAAIEHLQATLGAAAFDRHVASGAAMDIGDAVAYARRQIRLAQQTSGPAPGS